MRTTGGAGAGTGGTSGRTVAGAGVSIVGFGVSDWPHAADVAKIDANAMDVRRRARDAGIKV
jgi:hypothetical protein